MIKRKHTGVTGKAVIFSLVILFFLPALTLSPGDRYKKEKKDVLQQIKHLFFLAENDLYDGRILLRLKDRIGLTGEQEKKIEDLMLAHETVSIRSSAEIKIKELQFASYLKSRVEKIDRKQVERHIREIGSEKTRMIVHYMNYLLDLRNLLTPGQKEILKQMREEKKEALRRLRKRKLEEREAERKKKRAAPAAQ
jgi:Spy/CpxP family protein refolding chaperone